MDTLNKVTISTQTVKKDILNPFVISYVNKESVARDEDQEVSVLTLNKENLAPIFYEKKDTEAFVLTESKESEPLTLKAQKKDESFSKEPNFTENNYDLPQGTSLIQNNNETASISAQNNVHKASILTVTKNEVNYIDHDKDEEATILPQINDHVTNILTQNEEKVANILYEKKDKAAFGLTVNKENEAPFLMAEIIDESLSSLTKKKDDEASNTTENNYMSSLIQNDNETASISAQNNVHNASNLTVLKSELNNINYDQDKEAPSLPQSGRNHVTKMYTQNEEEVPIKLPKKVEFNLTETDEEKEPILIQSNAIKRLTFVSHKIDFNDAPDTEVCNMENEKNLIQTWRSASDSKLNINYYRCAVLMPTSVIQSQVIPLNKIGNDSITNITMKPKKNTQPSCENRDKKYAWDLKEFLSLRSNQWTEWAAQKRNAMFKTPGHSECKNDVTDNNIETSVPDLSDQNVENENTMSLKPATYDETILNTNKDNEIDILNTDTVCMIPSKISSKSSINSEISNNSDNKTLLVSDIYNAGIQKTVDCDDTCLLAFNEKIIFNKINKTATPSLSVVLALTKVLPESSKVNTASNLPEYKDKTSNLPEKAAILPLNEDLTSLLSQNKSLNNSTSSQLITLDNAEPFTVPFDKENITLKLDSSKENAPNLKETAILIQSIENGTPVPFEKDGEMASLNSFNNNKVASDLCFIKLDSKLKTIEQETRVWFQSKDEITASNDKIVSNVSLSKSEEPSKAKEELKPIAGSIKMTQKVVDGKEMTHYGNNLTQGAFKLNVCHPAPIKSVINQLKGKNIKKLYKKSKGIIGFFTKPFKGSDGGSSHHR